MSCEAAATLDHWGEIVVGRMAAGILGMLALAGWLLTRRRFTRPSRPPFTQIALVAVTLFGLAAVALLGPPMLQLVSGDWHGAGAGIADGLVATAVAAAAAILGVRRAHRPPIAAASQSTGAG